jgi:hypothetical protein
MNGPVYMNQPDPSPLNRRDFLGTLGLILAMPSLPSALTAETTKSSHEGIFDGSLHDLASSVQLDRGWQWEFDALIASVDQPRSEWIVGPQSKLEIAMDWCSLSPEQLVSSLKSHGVRTQGELDFSWREKDATSDQNLFVELVVCERPSQVRELWEQVKACKAEWELMPSKSAGEAMFISNGGNAIAGKTWFLRANVLASVVAYFMPDESAARFAKRLDEHLCANLRKVVAL